MANETKKRVEIELGYRAADGSVLTGFSGNLRRAFDQAGKEAANASQRLGLVDQAVGRLNLGAGALDTQMAKTGRGMLNLAGVGGKLVAALGGALSVAAVIRWGLKTHEVFAATEKDLSRVATMLDRTSMGPAKYQSTLEGYRTAVKGMAVEFGQSVNSLSDGLYNILSASVDSSQATDVLRIATMAAEAGFTDAKVSVDFITSALNAYQLSADQAGRVSDVAFATIARGKTTYQELAASIGQVAPMAAASGIQLEQLGAMLATLTRQGIKTTEAMTAINALIAQFAKGSEQSRKAWYEMSAGTRMAGTELTSALLVGKNFTETVKVMAGATSQQRAALLGDVSAMKAFNAISKDADGYQKDLKRTLNAQGETQEALGKTLDNSEKKTRALNERFQSLYDTIGQKTKPQVDALKEALGGLLDVLNKKIQTDGTLGQMLAGGAAGAGAGAVGGGLVGLLRGGLSGGAAGGLRGGLWGALLGSLLPVLVSDTKNLFKNGLSSLAPQKASDFNTSFVDWLNYLATGMIPDLWAQQKKQQEMLPGVLKSPDSSWLDSLLVDEVGTGPDSARKVATALNTPTPTKRGITDEEAAKINAAQAKLTREYIANVAASVDLEKQLRLDGLNAHERNLAQMAERYDETYQKIDDLVMAEVYTEEQATALKAQLDRNYLKAKEKAQADHDKGLLRSVQTYGLKGRELKQKQLEYELKDLEEAGHSAILLEQYKAQRLEEINKGWLEKTLDYYLETENLIEDGAKNAMQGTQSALADFFKDGLSDFQGFCDAIEEAWWQMLAQLVAQWTMSGIAGILKDLLNLITGKGFSFDNTLKGFGITDLLNLGSTAKSAVDVASWVSSAFGGGVGVEKAIAAAYGIINGGPAAGAGVGAVGSYGGTFAGGEFAGTFGGTGGFNSASLAAMFASPAGAMAMAVLPGMIGALFHDEISGALASFGLWDDSTRMTPEEAISNWEGSSRFVEVLSQSLDGLRNSTQGIDQDFGLFSSTARDFAADFERLADVANWSAAELAAAKAALSPTAQAYLEAGQAANKFEGSVEGLVRRMNAEINSYTMTSSATREYNDEIDRLAASLGLTGDELTAFRDEIWDLANTFSNGGEEATRFGESLDDFVNQTLGDITEQADNANDAVRDLLDSMNSANNTSVNSPSSNKTTTTSTDSDKTVGIMHTGGLVNQFLARLPKYHSGGDVLSWLQPGEYVVRRDMVNAATLPALRAINTGALPSHLSDGGSYRGGNTINVAVHLDNIGAGVDVAALTAAAAEGARAGALAALKKASEAGQAVVHARGVYGQDTGY